MPTKLKPLAASNVCLLFGVADQQLQRGFVCVVAVAAVLFVLMLLVVVAVW